MVTGNSSYRSLRAKKMMIKGNGKKAILIGTKGG
jgi:hypothetical protein